MRSKTLWIALIVIFATVNLPENSFAQFFKSRRPAASSAAPAATPASQGASQATQPAPEATASKGATRDGQISPGTYESISLGTEGGHARDPGSTGPLIVGSDGRVSGSLYNYSDRTFSDVSGSVNLATGQGNVTVRNRKDGNTDTYTIYIKTTTKTYSFLEGNYQKVGSSSKGQFWGLK